MALLLPVVVLVVLLVAQIGLVWRDQLLVVHAAREGARMSAVTSDPATIREAAIGAIDVDSGRLRVSVDRRDGPGGLTTVKVTMSPLSAAPLVGRALGGRSVSASTTMLVEASAGEPEHENGAVAIERFVAVATLG